MRGLIAVICLAFAGWAHASSYVSEISDLWYAPGEDGWGVNMVLQKNVAFATFYVYDANRNPVWFTAILDYAPGYVFSGNLYADRGPWYGGTYDSATVTERQAGQATFTLASLDHATLSYTIDGVTVTKALQRLTFTAEDYSGSYTGGFTVKATECTPSSLNHSENVLVRQTVSQIGSAFSLSMTRTDNSVDTTCTLDGTYSQTGKLGAVAGSYSCTSGSYGSFSLVEMTPTISGFTARASGHNQYCQWSGYIGGVRPAQ